MTVSVNFLLLMIISLALRKAQVVLTLYSVRTIVDRFIDGGRTANLCTIDLSKAFDKVNHNHLALFIKLMKRRIPIMLLDLLVYWLEN